MKFATLAALSVALCSCSSFNSAPPAAIGTVVEDVCLPIVSAEAPSAAPLCVLADEFAAAVAAYVQAHDGIAPLLPHTDGPTIAPVDLYASLAARPAVAARAAKPKPCPKPAAGKVAP